MRTACRRGVPGRVYRSRVYGREEHLCAEQCLSAHAMEEKHLCAESLFPARAGEPHSQESVTFSRKCVRKCVTETNFRVTETNFRVTETNFKTLSDTFLRVLP